MASRKELRKAARQGKKQQKHQALLQHQKFRKSKPKSDNTGIGVLRNCSTNEQKITLDEIDGDQKEGSLEVVKECANVRKTDGKNKKFSLRESESDSDSDSDRENAKHAAVSRMSKRGQKGDKKKSKTKFEEFLELETKAGPSMEEDLEMEWRLAKKLKLRKGKLDDGGDGLNSLLEGISSSNDLSEDEYIGRTESETESLQHIDHKNNKKKGKKKKSDREVGLDEEAFHDMLTEDSISFDSDEEDAASAEMEMDSETERGENIKQQKSKKRKRKRSKAEQDNSSDGVTSDMEQANLSFELGEEAEATTELETDTACASDTQRAGKYVAPHLRSRSGDESQEYLQIRRRVRGLLNRMSESNIESITGEVFSIFQSVSRAVASQIIIEEVLASCAGGPRGNEQYAAVFAAFVAGMASMAGIDFGARLMASLAKLLKDEYSKEDNLSLRNLSLLLSYLCIFGVCSRFSLQKE